MNIKLVILLILLYVILKYTINLVSSFEVKENLSNENISDNNLEIEIEPEVIKEKKEIVTKDKKNVKFENSKFILYWASWCGICTKMKSQWNMAKEKLKSKYPNLEIIDINCDDPKSDKCYIIEDGKHQKLDGVPTIIFRKNNIDIEYKRNDMFMGDRSENELVKFCSINI
jgi:thiol-disulfide isomerase/thioredoxin